MYYGNIKPYSIENGPGVRVSLFLSGCRNECPGCFSRQTWDFHFGEPFTEDTENTLFEMLDKPFVKGLTVLGGEPMEPENQYDLLQLLKRFHKRFPEKTVWVYTGFKLTRDEQQEWKFFDFSKKDEKLKSRANTPWTVELLANIDVLVDGRFEIEKRDPSLQFRGSSNQRIIDLSHWMHQ